MSVSFEIRQARRKGRHELKRRRRRQAKLCGHGRPSKAKGRRITRPGGGQIQTPAVDPDTGLGWLGSLLGGLRRRKT